MKSFTLFFSLLFLFSCNSGTTEKEGSAIEVENISITPPKTNASFTPSIEGPLRVLSASPLGSLQAVESGFSLAVTFSSPMTSLGEPVPIPPGQITLEPFAEGELRWEGTQTLVFEPASPLQSATLYTATLATGLQSIDGQTLEESYVWTFEMPRPKLSSSFPRNNELYAEPFSSIRLNYNTNLDTTRLNSYFALYEEPSRLEIPFELLTPAPDTVILKPLEHLTKGSLYRVYVQPGVPPAMGELGTIDEVSYTFRVHPELRFERIYQGSEWGIPALELNPSKSIGFNFSTQVRYSDVVKALSFTPDVQMPSDAENNTWYISENINLNIQFQPETPYTFRIDSLYDVHGQLLTGIRGSFNTKPYNPALNIPTGLVVLEAEEQPFLPMSVTNWQSIQVGMERLMHLMSSHTWWPMTGITEIYWTCLKDKHKTLYRLPKIYPLLYSEISQR